MRRVPGHRAARILGRSQTNPAHSSRRPQIERGDLPATSLGAKVELGKADLDRKPENVCSQRHHTDFILTVNHFQPIYLRQALRLFECIGTMRKGSPRGKIAETSWSGLAQKPQTGEPNEHPSLYRIRRPQENCQLLRKDRRRTDCRGRQAGSGARQAKRMGSGAEVPVAGRHGGNAVQRLDLRYVEALCPAAADGTPGKDESHHRWEEEERSPGCANHR